MVLNATLRELPGILTNSARPKHLPQWVGHYDAHVRPVPIIINHLLHLPPVPDVFIVYESIQFSNLLTLTLDSDPNLTLYSDPIIWR